MFKKRLIIFFIVLFPNYYFAQKISKKYFSNQTVTYQEAIDFYKNLEKKTNKAKLLTYGATDIGKPLHLFVISNDGDFNPDSIKKKNKRIILINNGIHAGEPDGVDASIKLAENLLNDTLLNFKKTEHLVICIIPVYNIDGILNRDSCRRPNQNGPEESGIRSNAKNLDLNRDFIKFDSENAKAFAGIFHQWNPDIFVDTHVSDGADYTYTMTLIATQQDKFTPLLGTFLKKEMEPALYKRMKNAGWEMSPYVELFKKTPDDGIIGFLETPRYSTGYAALFNSIGFVTETHMLKPFSKRVESTYEFLWSLLEYSNENYEKIGELRKQADQYVREQKQFPIEWTLDTTRWEILDFKGYEAKYKPSNVSGQPRLYYDEKAPYTKPIKKYNLYKPKTIIEKPAAYVVPQAWKTVIERLQMNGIKMKKLSKDTSLIVESYYIDDYKTAQYPYESHYVHSEVRIRKEIQKIQYYKGDYVIETNQKFNRYIIETLEPQATDSYFNWNFFDAILQQKEGFSDYAFEDTAEEMLKQHPELKKELDLKKQQDPLFAKDSWAQLQFIYQHSCFREKSLMRYPVARITHLINLSLE